LDDSLKGSLSTFKEHDPNNKPSPRRISNFILLVNETMNYLAKFEEYYENHMEDSDKGQ